MIRTEPIIAVKDVKASAKWYKSLLGCGNTHDNGVFDQLVDADGTVLLCLHRWGDHGHPSLRSPERGQAGNGLLLFFRVDDFESAWERAESLGAETVESPRYNSYAEHKEFALRDQDGYFITVCSRTD